MVVAVFAVWVQLELGGSTVTTWVNDLTEVAAAGVATVACLVAARQHASTRRAWTWLAAATASWAAGQVVWSWFELRNGEAPFPSPADIGFLLFGPLAAIGVLSFPSAPRRSRRRYQIVLDGLVIAGSLLFVTWATALGAAASAGSETPFAQIVALAYPVSDLVLVTVVFAALSVAIGRWRIALLLLGSGLILFAVADSSFAYFSASDSYGLGNAMDAGWVAGFLLIALAASTPAIGERVRRDPADLATVQLVVPYVPLGLAVAVGVAEVIVTGELDRTLRVMAAVIVALVIVRQLVALLESADLRRTLVERNTKLAQISLRQRLILEGAADGIVGLDRAGAVAFANPAALESLDRSSRVVLGAPFHEIVHGAACDGCPLSLHLDTLRPATDATDRFVRPDGSDIPVEYSLTPFGEGGVVAGAVLVFRDITERRAVERMKDEFLSIVSHELRTPLTSIRGTLGLLGSGLAGELPEQARRMVDIAADNSERLARLINDLLDMERIATGHADLVVVDCDAAALVRAALDVVTPMADGAAVALQADGDAGGRVRADPDRIVQVLTNLLANAVKFSERGSVVSVGVTADGARVRFSVTDTGRGIPTDKLTAIFDRFQQVDASDSRDRGGAGLGLPIAKAIVEQHGGRIWAVSTEGAGSTFSFELPGVAPTPVASADGRALAGSEREGAPGRHG